MHACPRRSVVPGWTNSDLLLRSAPSGGWGSGWMKFKTARFPLPDHRGTSLSEGRGPEPEAMLLGLAAGPRGKPGRYAVRALFFWRRTDRRRPNSNSIAGPVLRCWRREYVIAWAGRSMVPASTIRPCGLRRRRYWRTASCRRQRRVDTLASALVFGSIRGQVRSSI
jgi:hypothetical protein